MPKTLKIRELNIERKDKRPFTVKEDKGTPLHEKKSLS